MTDKFLVNEIQECMNDDASKSSHPLSVPVSTDAEIRRIFDPISYTKGNTYGLICFMISFCLL